MWMTGVRLWGDMMKSGIGAAETGARFAEMVTASADVVESRSRSIADACRDPFGGDYRELGRMVPEKIDAFAKAGRIAVAEVAALQSAAFANWQHLTSLALSGRTPTPTDLTRLATRSTRMATRAADAAGKTMAPIHRAATGNARRLKRKAG